MDFDDADVHTVEHNNQEELFTRYCNGITDRIRQATSRAEALKIVEKACSDFGEACESSIIKSAFHKYLHDLVEDQYPNESLRITGS